MNQYRLGASDSSNNSTVISKPQKLTLLQKLYRSFLKAWNFIALRGRQVLWIGSTGFIIIMWPLIYLSILESSSKGPQQPMF